MSNSLQPYESQHARPPCRSILLQRKNKNNLQKPKSKKKKVHGYPHPHTDPANLSSHAWSNLGSQVSIPLRKRREKKTEGTAPQQTIPKPWLSSCSSATMQTSCPVWATKQGPARNKQLTASHAFVLMLIPLLRKQHP